MKIIIILILLSLFSFNCKKESNSSGIETKPNIYTVTIEGKIISNNHIGLDSVILNLQNPFRFDTTTTNGTFNISFPSDGVDEISTHIKVMRQSYYDTLIFINYSPSKNKIALPEVIIRNAIDTNTQKNNVIMPLKLGNAWSFKTIEFNSNGDTLRKDFITEIKITSDTTINNLMWKLSESNNGFLISRLFRNDSLGLNIGNLSGNVIQIYPYPAHLNTGILLWNVAAIDTTINTALGDMKCYIYQMRSNEVAIVRHIYSPQFGPIYLEIVNQTIHGTSYIAQKLWIISAIIN